tara:strand:+ start:476 stop:709 length:234 start_codon:yes stop_codon:yes gene_type:complete
LKKETILLGTVITGQNQLLTDNNRTRGASTGNRDDPLDVLVCTERCGNISIGGGWIATGAPELGPISSGEGYTGDCD